MTPSPTLVLEQLERMLQSSAFRGAARSSTLLRFLVEQTLAGHADRLKDYTLGAEALGPLSPDGRTLVAVVSGGDTPRLWVRPVRSSSPALDGAAFTFRPLPGTEHASLPFWSPDAAWWVFSPTAG